jgi:Phage capsid family
MSSIQETLSNVEKALNTPSYPSGLPTLIRENLDEFINRLTMKETPIRDRLPRKKGSGLAASWNVLSAMGVGNSAFAEGATPTEDNTTYVRRSAVYKELGKKKSISDRMLAAGASFTDIESELTEVAMREVIQDEETLIVTGDATGSPLQFDGLQYQITGGSVIDDASNVAGFRTILLNKAVAQIQTNYGVRPTAIYVSYLMKRAINESLTGDVRVNLDATNTVGTGVDVGFFQSAVGKLPILASYAVPTSTSGSPAVTVGDIYVVTEKAQGGDVLYMEDLYGMGKGMLDRTGAAIKFMVTECTVMVNRAVEYHVRIRNVVIPN